MGSAALDMCLVGRGSVDLYFEWGPHCWDFAAASLIVEESGGVCTTTTGKIQIYFTKNGEKLNRTNNNIENLI